jgi:hypothetical protein
MVIPTPCVVGVTLPQGELQGKIVVRHLTGPDLTDNDPIENFA